MSSGTSDLTIYVPSTAIDAYKDANYWNSLNIEGYTVSESGIARNKESVILRKNLHENLFVIDCREESAKASYTWTSSNEDVAIVDENGKVTAVANGTAIITATTNDESKATATCNVSVMESGSNFIYTIDAISHCKKNVVLPIYMDNAEQVGNVQFDIKLPSGVYINEIIKGNDRFDEELDHVVSFKIISGSPWTENSNTTYRVTIISNSNYTIYDTDLNGKDCRNNSPLINITLGVYNFTPEGTQDVFIKNAVMSSNIGGVTTKYTCSSTSTSLTIPLAHSVQILSTNGGYVDIEGEAYNGNYNMADDNGVVMLSACPYDGYKFVRWMKGEEEYSTENPLTLIVTENISLTAEFAVKQYTVKFIADSKVILEQVLDYGTEIIIPDAPEKEGFEFYSWGYVPGRVPAYNVEFVASYIMIGDIYEDETLDVADVTKLAGIVLNNTWLDTREKKQADVYKDNAIDVADISTLVNMVLKYNQPVTEAPARGSSDYSSVFTSDITSITTTGTNLNLGIQNISEGLTSLQFNINAEVNSLSLNKAACPTHSLVTRKMEDGSTRVIIYSMACADINYMNSQILSIELKNSDAETLNISNIIYTDSEGNKHSVADAQLNLSEATGICEVNKADMNITAEKGTISVRSAAKGNITVCSTSGTIVYNGLLNPTETTRIAVPAGVYLVNNIKVVVK